MLPTVLLFDIDGTLISAGGAGRRAVEGAFADLHGAPSACAGFRFDGMTDRAIVRLGLEAIGAAPTPAGIDAVLARYVARLREEVWRTPPEAYVVHPGVPALLGALRGAEVAVGVGTGNVRAGAHAKLERAGLHEAFAFGGYGDDDEARAALLACGAARGRAALGVDAARVVVIGDTPKDVAAARAIGAECLAVATGGYDLDALRACGPTWAVATLAEARVAERLVGPR